MPYASDASVYGRREDLAGALYTAKPNQNYVATQILPPFPVTSREGRLHKVNMRHAMRLQKTKRATGSGFVRVSTPLAKDTFACEERGAEEPVDRVNKGLYRGSLDQEEVAAITAHAIVAIDHEKDVADALFNETTFPASSTTGLTVSNAWSVAASGTPISDVAVCKKNIRTKVGSAKFVLLANINVVEAAWRCAQITARILQSYPGMKGTIEGDPNLDILASILGVSKIICPDCMYNSAAEGATPTMAQIWSDTYAFVAAISDERVLMTPQLGRTFYDSNVFERDLEAALGGPVDDRFLVEMYPEDKVDSDVVRVREFTDEVILDTSAGNLLKSVL